MDLASCHTADNIPILFQHNPVWRIGHTDKVQNDGVRLTASGVLESASEQAADILSAYEEGAQWQASIGTGPINIDQKKMIQPGETVVVNDLELSGPFILLHNVSIREISVVPAGADPATDVLFASLIRSNTTMTFEEFALAKGFDLTTLTEENRAALEALYHLIEIEPGDPVLEVEEPAEAVTAEVTAEEEEEKPAEAVTAEGTIEEDAEEKPSETVKASSLRRVFQSVNVPGVRAAAPLKKSEVLTASALLNLGVDAQWLAKNGFSRRVVDAAEKKPSDGSILSLMGETLRASGIAVDYRNARRIADDYRELLTASGISTKQFGDVNVFSPIINKQLRYKFEHAEPIWRKLFRQRTVTDFNEVAAVDFELGSAARDLKEDEDYPVAALRSSGAKFAVSKQGITAAISFESQINDDLGTIDRIGDELLWAILDVQTDKFWTLFWANINKNMTAAKGCRITAPLSVEGLTAAKKAMKSKKNAAGRFLNVPAAFLLVPPALEDAADNLFNWQFGDAFAGNPHIGKYQVLSDAYLGADGGYSGATDTNWLMLADPARYPMGEYAAIAGYEAPTIKETWYDHKDALNLRALGTVGFHNYDTKIPAVFSTGAGN